MKQKVMSMFLLFMLLISFSAYAINFTAEETYKSVVVVYTDTGVGSGFSIKENILITNAHVVSDSKKVAVNLYDGSTIDGTVIKTDFNKDLALIKTDTSITPLNLNAENVSIGQEVYAIGAPRDMPYTMTKGIISALDRKLGDNSYIQLDASVNSGNSGGPLVDDNGNVIGIITLKASDAEGIGFAIPVSDISNFIENIEEPVPTDENGNEIQSIPEENSPDAELMKVTKQNELLKIVVIVLSVLLACSVLIILRLALKEKKKDEFDFEIEIEE